MFAEVAEKGPLKIFIKSIRTIEKKNIINFLRTLEINQ